MIMKKLSIAMLALIACFVVVAGALAADKEAIKQQVDEIVVALDEGKTPQDFKDAAKKEPYYVFIMQEDGTLLVHPSLEGQSLKEKAEPVYNALIASTPEGNWVGYEWQGKQKHTYVRTTKNGLIVGSGYSE